MAERFKLDENGMTLVDAGLGGERYFLDDETRLQKLVDLLNHLDNRVRSLDAESRARQLAGRALWDAGYLTVRHDEDCPEDDTCECPEAILTNNVLDEDADLEEVRAAIKEIERRDGDFPEGIED